LKTTTKTEITLAMKLRADQILEELSTFHFRAFHLPVHQVFKNKNYSFLFP